jgi:GAF domain-containing protein
MTPKKTKGSKTSRQSTEGLQLAEELETRKAELLILSSIQEGIASGLDIDSIFELAGERIAEIFPGEGIALYTYDPDTQWGEAKYILEEGVRHYPPPFESGPIGKKAAETKQPLVLSSRAEFEAIGATTIQGTAPSLSGIYTPLIVNDRPVGALNIERTSREHAFDYADIRLVTTITRSLSVALENARLLKETEERNAELAIINSVQAALAAQLNIQGIYEAVGEKLREIFDSQVIAIYSADLETRINTTEYAYEKGQKFEPVSIPFSSLHDHLIALNDTYVFNGDFPEFAAQFADYRVSTGEMPKSLVGVPVGRKSGATKLLTLTLQDIDGEKTFTVSDVRLLETLANSMSVALENARLFDESQRLLKETEQRAAELQIINSVQEGLASKLEMQAIYDLVGDKIREIFDADTTFIAFHDRQNNRIVAPYYTDKGERIETTTRPYGQGLVEIMIESGKSLLLGRDECLRRVQYRFTWL